MPTLKDKLEAAEEHILLPASSDDEYSESSEVEEKIADPFHVSDDSDSDDAPEAFSFKSVKERIQSLKKRTKQVIKMHDDEKRMKRKELQEQLIKLKSEKKRKIEEKFLPSDILENLNDNQHLPDAESADDEGNGKDIPSEEENEKVEEHGPTLFKCKVLAEQSKVEQYLPENVKYFKNQLLYGGRIRREKSTKEAFLKKEKQQSRHK